MPTELHCGSRVLNLDQPRVMGILNVTPDSFSDGGRFDKPDAALRQAERMLEEGADIIDIGGESTRPGAADVSEADELRRVVPVIEALARRFDTVISVDTSKPSVMRAAVASGAGLINDVRALGEAGALQAAADLPAAVCLMHMQGQPRTMQQAPQYADVVEDVAAFLRERADACRAAGIAARRLIVDPGFGFGKTLAHNLSLLKHLRRLADDGLPVLVGLSRKSMIGALLDRPVEQRLQGSVALAMAAVVKGAAVVRVHDVKETVDALRIWQAVTTAE